MTTHDYMTSLRPTIWPAVVIFMLARIFAVLRPAHTAPGGNEKTNGLSADLLIAVTTRPDDTDTLRKAVVANRATVAEDHPYAQHARMLQQAILADTIGLLLRPSDSPGDLLALCQQAADNISAADRLITQLDAIRLHDDDLPEVIANATLRRAARNRMVLASRMPDTIEAQEHMGFVRFCRMADAAL